MKKLFCFALFAVLTGNMFAQQPAAWLQEKANNWYTLQDGTLYDEKEIIVIKQLTGRK